MGPKPAEAEAAGAGAGAGAKAGPGEDLLARGGLKELHAQCGPWEPESALEHSEYWEGLRPRYELRSGPSPLWDLAPLAAGAQTQAGALAPKPLKRFPREVLRAAFAFEEGAVALEAGDLGAPAAAELLAAVDRRKRERKERRRRERAAKKAKQQAAAG